MGRSERSVRTPDWSWTTPAGKKRAIRRALLISEGAYLLQNIAENYPDWKPGEKSYMSVMEVGCGTGFFTIPAAQLIGDKGCLIAMDVLSDYIEQVVKKVQAANLKNVRVVKRDALYTGLDAESIDKVLLFGVIPYPSLPLNRLLPEMYRILKPEGSLAIWMFPVSGWVPKSILQSRLFTYIKKRNGVFNYSRMQDKA